jgi:aspartyl/asparaginyl beta-hydroxylase (cupin superfamily)
MTLPSSTSRSDEPPHYTIDGDYAGSEPAFYDTKECPWTELLEAHWREILDEIAGVATGGGAPLKANFDPYGFDIEGWRTANLQTYLWRYAANRRRFPRTASIVERIPNLTSAFINVLDPGTTIPLHFGDSNAIQRCHLGLVVPARAEQCGIEVRGERRGWEEGRTLVFCDAHPHRAWNLSAGRRIILVVDVMRPEYVRRRYRICGNVLAAIALTLVATRLGLSRWVTSPAVRVLHRSLGAAIGLVLRLRATGSGSGVI